jgi:uncharacterized protein YhbP (UPF0306 family)
LALRASGINYDDEELNLHRPDTTRDFYSERLPVLETPYLPIWTVRTTWRKHGEESLALRRFQQD